MAGSPMSLNLTSIRLGITSFEFNAVDILKLFTLLAISASFLTNVFHFLVFIKNWIFSGQDGQVELGEGEIEGWLKYVEKLQGETPRFDYEPGANIPTYCDVPGEIWRMKARKEVKLWKKQVAAGKSAREANANQEAKLFEETALAHFTVARTFHEYAAREITRYLNDENEGLSKCDLHGLYPREAEEYARSHLERCRMSSGLKQTIITPGTDDQSSEGYTKVAATLRSMCSPKEENGVFIVNFT